jgi:hypothetical protein
VFPLVRPDVSWVSPTGVPEHPDPSSYQFSLGSAVSTFRNEGLPHTKIVSFTNRLPVSESALMKSTLWQLFPSALGLGVQ